MAYERINWQNGEAGNTPLNANNLNRMDMTLEEHDQKIGDHDYEIENLKTGEQGITEEINKKMDRINPQGSGTLSIPAVNADNITAQTVEADEIKVTKVGSKDGTAPVVFDNDILVNGITTPIGSLASSASAKAESAERIANEADRTAGTAKTTASTAYSRVQENIFRTDKLEGIVGGGVGESIPQYTYYDGKYLRPDGEIENYNDSARVIEFEINKNSDSGCNVIFKNVDLIPTDASILCGFYNAAGILLGEEMRGLIIMADFDEDTGKMTRQYISYCVVPAPYYAKYVRISGIANGAVDIAIQNTLSDAVAELQSRSTSALVLTNPSPLLATDGKKILGIDAVGRSWQDGTQKFTFTQGAIVPTVGSALNQDINANNSRCTSNIIQLPMGSVISAPSGYEIYLAHATTENGNIDIAQTWVTTYTTAVDGYWRVVCRNKNNTSANIVPSECNVTANASPTPSNPIPITNADPEVTAHTKNLFDHAIDGSQCIGEFYVNTAQYNYGITPNANNYAFRIPIPSAGNYYLSSSYISSRANVRFENANKEPIGGVNFNTWLKQYTFDDEVKYIVLAIPKTSIDNYFQLEKGDDPTDYVSYQRNSITLPYEPKSVETAANELIVYEDGTGKIIKRVGEADLSTLDWEYESTNNRFLSSSLQNVIKKASARTMLMLSDIYTSITDGSSLSSTWNNCVYNGNNDGYVIVHDHRTTNVSTFKSNISGHILYYPLATPVEIPLTAEEVAAVRQLMTYKGTTIIDSEMDVVSVTYSGDIKAYIDYRIEQIINPTALNEVAPMNLDETEE